MLGTIFFSAFSHHLPTYAVQVTAWACLAPLAAAFVLVFRLPCSRGKSRRTRDRAARPGPGRACRSQLSRMSAL